VVEHGEGPIVAAGDLGELVEAQALRVEVAPSDRIRCAAVLCEVRRVEPADAVERAFDLVAQKSISFADRSRGFVAFAG
jgi:hypothetical protein